MLEYYIMTAVEFTCTSVDLDDKILRLFNKKTTPFLPVCKAVQMSGSFPGAFKAQKWKKEWGKYTIFYSRYKVEVDLTGHEFTDGGLLANFPVKYLDNPDICKKYFSHIPKEDNTILLGFGLDCL
jgi:predicted acylesterase/phospholipase RssA